MPGGIGFTLRAGRLRPETDARRITARLFPPGGSWR